MWVALEEWIRSHNVLLPLILFWEEVSRDLGHVLWFHDKALVRSYGIPGVSSYVVVIPICNWLETPI